jgi:hypothetical protein
MNVIYKYILVVYCKYEHFYTTMVVIRPMLNTLKNKLN